MQILGHSSHQEVESRSPPFKPTQAFVTPSTNRRDAEGLPRLLPVSHRHTLSPMEESCHPEVAVCRRLHMGRPEDAGGLQILSEESLEMSADTASL